MKSFLTLLIVISAILLHGAPVVAQIETQEETAAEVSPNVEDHHIIPAESDTGEIIFLVVEEPAQFPGDINELYDYIGKTMVYPKECIEQNIQGRVYVTFVVEKDGSISNIKIIRGVYAALDQEAIRVISGMPKWKPAKNLGKVVRSKMTIPINFKLTKP